jgi:hypothetical protein
MECVADVRLAHMVQAYMSQLDWHFHELHNRWIKFDHMVWMLQFLGFTLSVAQADYILQSEKVKVGVSRVANMWRAELSAAIPKLAKITEEVVGLRQRLKQDVQQQAKVRGYWQGIQRKLQLDVHGGNVDRQLRVAQDKQLRNLCKMDIPQSALWLHKAVKQVVDLAANLEHTMEYAKGVVGPSDSSSDEVVSLAYMAERVLMLCFSTGLMGLPPIRVHIICSLLITHSSTTLCKWCAPHMMCPGNVLLLDTENEAQNAMLIASHHKAGQKSAGTSRVMTLWVSDPHLRALLWLWGGNGTSASLRDACYYGSTRLGQGDKYLLMTKLSRGGGPKQISPDAYSTLYLSNTGAGCNPQVARRAFFTSLGVTKLQDTDFKDLENTLRCNGMRGAAEKLHSVLAREAGTSFNMMKEVYNIFHRDAEFVALVQLLCKWLTHLRTLAEHGGCLYATVDRWEGAKMEEGEDDRDREGIRDADIMQPTPDEGERVEQVEGVGLLLGDETVVEMEGVKEACVPTPTMPRGGLESTRVPERQEATPETSKKDKGKGKVRAMDDSPTQPHGEKTKKRKVEGKSHDGNERGQTTMHVEGLQKSMMDEGQRDIHTPSKSSMGKGKGGEVAPLEGKALNQPTLAPPVTKMLMHKGMGSHAGATPISHTYQGGGSCKGVKAMKMMKISKALAQEGVQSGIGPTQQGGGEDPFVGAGVLKEEDSHTLPGVSTNLKSLKHKEDKHKKKKKKKKDKDKE